MPSVDIRSPNLSRRQRVRKPAVRSAGGIVVAQNRWAAEVGARILKAGGNAMDAAIATSFAVGVAEPWMSGIGGNGAMLVKRPGEETATAIDFGARAPRNLDPADYPLADGGVDDNLFGWPKVKEDRNLVGVTAVCAPRQLAGLEEAHKLFGSRPWQELVEPAIELAATGIVVDHHTALMIADGMRDLLRDAGARAVFLPDGFPPMPAASSPSGAQVRLPNPALARTLRTIAVNGPRAFYDGPLANAVVGELKALGGVHVPEDFNTIRAEVMPARVAAAGVDHAIHIVPRLNGGPTMLAARSLLEASWRPGAETGPDAAAFNAYAASLRAAWASRLVEDGDDAPASNTTHLTVIDRDGMVVTLTQTLLSLFGAKVLLPETGVLMNNAVNWFDPRPGKPNSMAPNKRLLCNYAPAIVTGPDLVAGLGGCGGRKILPAVYQLMSMIIDYGFDLDRAFHQPRIDVSGPDFVTADGELGPEVIERLAAEHPTVIAERIASPNFFTIAGAVRRSAGMNEGATEPAHPWSEAVAEEEV